MGSSRRAGGRRVLVDEVDDTIGIDCRAGSLSVALWLVRRVGFAERHVVAFCTAHCPPNRWCCVVREAAEKPCLSG